MFGSGFKRVKLTIASFSSSSTPPPTKEKMGGCSTLDYELVLFLKKDESESLVVAVQAPIESCSNRILGILNAMVELAVKSYPYKTPYIFETS